MNSIDIAVDALARAIVGPENPCGCRACVQGTPAAAFFIVCRDCGNKRCPHATDHRHACTGSNEPGQVGSRYA